MVLDTEILQEMSRELSREVAEHAARMRTPLMVDVGLRGLHREELSGGMLIFVNG